MGVVIEFSRQTQANAPPRSDGRSAQILFFTGVRYQRMSDPAPGQNDGQSPTREGGKRRRKRG
jgi:hypothetical protein